MITVQETASYFENGRGSRLLGVRTLASRESPGAPVVIFCHPIDEVRYSSYSAVVAFARRLAAAGISSLRFDYAGFGDSEGETRDATIASFVADVRSAILMLVGDGADINVCLVGTGLGATIARIVAEEDPAVTRLVMFAPVVSGASYRDSLFRAEQMSFIPRGLTPPKQEEMLAGLDADGCIELKGEVFGKSFFRQLSAIDLIDEGVHFSGPLLIVSGPGHSHSGRLAAYYRERGYAVTSWLEEENGFWSPRPVTSDNLARDRELFDRATLWISQEQP